MNAVALVAFGTMDYMETFFMLENHVYVHSNRRLPII